MNHLTFVVAILMWELIFRPAGSFELCEAAVVG